MRTVMKIVAALAAAITFSACESMPTSFGTAPADAATQSEWTQPRPPDAATRIDGGRLIAEPPAREQKVPQRAVPPAEYFIIADESHDPF